MPLRFTDTEKWSDLWFRKLPPWGKLLWSYLCDRCDCAGVWQADKEIAELYIGCPIPWDEVVEVFDGRIRILSGEKWLLVKFVSFQFRKGINPKDHYGKQVMATLARHGLNLSDVPFPEIKDSPSQGASQALHRGPGLGIGLEKEKTGKREVDAITIAKQIRKENPCIKFISVLDVSSAVSKYGQEEIAGVLVKFATLNREVSPKEWQEALNGRRSAYGGYDFWHPLTPLPNERTNP